MNFFKNLRESRIFRFIGPGLLVTVGFIDPGNWAANIAGGSEFGYELLWVITLGTITLIVLQHNVAHLGIVTGKCLAEGIREYLPKPLARAVLGTAILANISVALAELLGTAIALNMLFKIPVKVGALIGAVVALGMIFTNTYRKLEKIIVGFVSIIGFSFLFELSLVDVQWNEALISSFNPEISRGSLLIAMGMFGAIVMPHNLFLHSEVIQSREWNKENKDIMKRELKYEFFDTLFSMMIGWVINSAMVILSVTSFFVKRIQVTELPQAYQLLIPLLGRKAAIIFAIGLLFAGISSSITAGMAGGTIGAGALGKEYNIMERGTKFGIVTSFVGGMLIILFVDNIFRTMIISQALLCLQLPITIASQLYLTSSRKVMGEFKNCLSTNIIISFLGVFVTLLNILVLKSYF